MLRHRPAAVWAVDGTTHTARRNLNVVLCEERINGRRGLRAAQLAKLFDNVRADLARLLCFVQRRQQRGLRVCALRLAASASSDIAKTPLSRVRKTISKTSMDQARE